MERWEKRCINGVCRWVKITEPTGPTITYHLPPSRDDGRQWIIDPPTIADDGETAIETPTPREVIQHVCATAVDWQPDDVFVDVGCGDGRWLEAAAEYPIQEVWGIERVASRVALARRRVARFGSKVRVQLADATKVDLSRGTVFVMYLNPDTIAGLVPKMVQGRARLIMSYQNEIPLEGTTRMVVRGKPFYLWRSRTAVVVRKRVWRFPVE